MRSPTALVTEEGMGLLSFTGSQFLTLGNHAALNLLPSSPYTVFAVARYTGSTSASIISRSIGTNRQYMFYLNPTGPSYIVGEAFATVATSTSYAIRYF
jgi:hypothetical protein